MASIMEPVKGKLTNPIANTIAVGSTAQPLYVALPTRRYLLVQNHDTSDPLWIDFDGVDAVESQPAVRILAGETFIVEGPYCPNGAISIIGPTGTQEFTAKQSI